MWYICSVGLLEFDRLFLRLNRTTDDQTRKTGTVKERDRNSRNEPLDVSPYVGMRVSHT